MIPSENVGLNPNENPGQLIGRSLCLPKPQVGELFHELSHSRRPLCWVCWQGALESACISRTRAKSRAGPCEQSARQPCFRAFRARGLIPPTNRPAAAPPEPPKLLSSALPRRDKTTLQITATRLACPAASPASGRCRTEGPRGAPGSGDTTAAPARGQPGAPGTGSGRMWWGHDAVGQHPHSALSAGHGAPPPRPSRPFGVPEKRPIPTGQRGQQRGGPSIPPARSRGQRRESQPGICPHRQTVPAVGSIRGGTSRGLKGAAEPLGRGLAAG